VTTAPRILRAGLTGGIASGKSTVAGFLRELGAIVVDADALVHELTAPGGAAHDEVVARFGRDIVGPDGRIDRATLGARVFADSGARRALEAIVHPHVRAEAARRFDAAARSGSAVVGVFDAALLVETGFHRDLDRLIVVRCAENTQIRRLAERGMSEADARARINAQAPLTGKLEVADYVIDTDVGLDETRRQTGVVYRSLVEEQEHLADGT
jgi:dephospho-CoA kinase